jgi:hypothetical protein
VLLDHVSCHSLAADLCVVPGFPGALVAKYAYVKPTASPPSMIPGPDRLSMLLAGGVGFFGFFGAPPLGEGVADMLIDWTRIRLSRW